MRNKIILSLLLVCVLTIPLFVKAITIDELKAKIADLQTQINQLIAQLAQQGDSPATAWCHSFNANLGIGSSGSEIAYLQTALEKEGLYQSQGKFSFDEKIASAIVAFQQKYKSEILTPWRLRYGNGFVGKSTRAKLNKLYGCGSFALKPTATTATPATTTTTTTTTIPVSNICTQDAKQCPDGSYVSRSGPNCAFAECPIVTPPPVITPPITQPPATPLETFSWNLEKGWNLISFPIKPVSDKIVDILKPIEGKYYGALSWNEITGKWFLYSATSSAVIDFNKSYSVNMKEPATLTIQGKKWNKTFAEWIDSFIFVNGWNLIGHPFLDQKFIKDFNPPYPLQNIQAYSSLQGKFITIYDRLAKIPYSTQFSTNNIQEIFEPGQGYMGSFYDCSIATYANICRQLQCVNGYIPKCNADGSDTTYLKGECYCAEKPYTMTKIGNPGLAQFPLNDSNDRLARGVKDLQLYQGKIYVGTGDSINNRGPINVWVFATGVDNPTFLNEYSIDDEEVTMLKVFGDTLYVPGADPKESWDLGNFYFKKDGIWTKKRTIPNGIHTTDFAVIDNQTIVLASGGAAQGEECFGQRFFVSKDNGETWKSIKHPFCDSKYLTYFYKLTPFNGYIFFIAGVFDANTKALIAYHLLKYSSQDETIEVVSLDIANTVLWKLLSPLATFKDRLVLEWYNKVEQKPELGYLEDPNSKNVIEIDASEVSASNRKSLVYGDTLYLFALDSNSRTKAVVYSSKDLINWKKEWTFEFPAMPTAIEFYDNAFYVGLSSNYDQNTKTYTDDEAGSIYKISR